MMKLSIEKDKVNKKQIRERNNSREFVDDTKVEFHYSFVQTRQFVAISYQANCILKKKRSFTCEKN